MAFAAFVAETDGAIVASASCQLHRPPYPDVLTPGFRRVGRSSRASRGRPKNGLSDGFSSYPTMAGSPIQASGAEACGDNGAVCTKL